MFLKITELNSWFVDSLSCPWFAFNIDLLAFSRPRSHGTYYFIAAGKYPCTYFELLHDLCFQNR